MCWQESDGDRGDMEEKERKSEAQVVNIRNDLSEREYPIVATVLVLYTMFCLTCIWVPGMCPEPRCARTQLAS